MLELPCRPIIHDAASWKHGAPLHQHQLYLSNITNHAFSVDRLALAYLAARMSSVVIISTLQSASLAGLSNVLAQVIQAYRTDKPLSLDYATLLQFVVFSLLATPPNILWQEYLEEKFPAKVVDDKGNQKLHKGNTAVKFLLDQTLGAVLNSYLFIAGIGALKGKDTSAILADCRRHVWPLITSGWKLWPLVSLMCFTVVPLHRRVLVGSTIGVFWGVFLSLLTAK